MNLLDYFFFFNKNLQIKYKDVTPTAASTGIVDTIVALTINYHTKCVHKILSSPVVDLAR